MSTAGGKRRRRDAEAAAAAVPAAAAAAVPATRKGPLDYAVAVLAALPAAERALLLSSGETDSLPALARCMDVIQFLASSKNEAAARAHNEHYAPAPLKPALLDRTLYSRFTAADVQGRARLSNFAQVPGGLQLWGLRFPTAEHAFHAGKAMLLGRNAVAARFAVGGDVAQAPEAAKRAGGKSKTRSLIGNMAAVTVDDGTGALRPANDVWDGGHSSTVMEQVLRAKLAADGAFGEALLSSGLAILVHQTRGEQDVRLSVILHKIRSELRAAAAAAAPVAADA